MPLVNPAGPTFISYRWADGSDAALDAARRLRASGVPVWLDRDDLPPGETATRLTEALESGVAGALLVATPRIAPRKTPEDYIHDLEIPTILDKLVPAGALVVVLNTAVDKAGKVNRKAPAVLYDRTDVSSYTQYSPLDGLEDMGRNLARERLRRLRLNRSDEALVIDVQTRRAATSFTSDGDLVFRTVPPVDSRVPSRVVWEDLATFTTWLPDVVANERPPEVRLTGGAHLAVAFAVGAALPVTSGIPVAVRATSGETWRVAAAAPRWDWRRLIAPRLSTHCLRWRGEGGALAVLVDLVPTAAPPTFIAHLKEKRESYSTGVIIDGNRTLDGDSGPRVVAEVATRIRELAARHGQHVHLFLRTPWAAAALLGTLLNTVSATLYEWDNTLLEPRYVKTISVASGLCRPLTDIHMPTT